MTRELCAAASWEEIATAVKQRVPGHAFLSFFAAGVGVSLTTAGRLTVALANDFSVRQASQYQTVMEECLPAEVSEISFLARQTDAAGAGERVAVEVVERALNERHLQGLRTRDAKAVERQAERPPGVITRLLAERGFWSLDPAAQLKLFEIHDLQGHLQVEPSWRGTPGVYEATVFAGLLTLWAGGDREQRSVQTSLRNLAEQLGFTWSGRTAQQLVDAIDLLTLTGYRVTMEEGQRGWTDLFHLLDRSQTRWDGRRNSPRSRITAHFSDVIWQAITQPRVLRPVDLAVLHAIGEQRHLAKRLFLYLEGVPMHPLGDGREGIERIVDERLAATLGARSQIKHFRSQLGRAGTAVVDTAPRYLIVELAPRTKRGLQRSDPRHVLRVVRSRLAQVD